MLPELRPFDMNAPLNHYRENEMQQYRLGVDARQQQMRQAAGQQIAAGDYAGAAGTAFAGGDIDLGSKIQQMPLERQLRLYDMLGRAAEAHSTPDQWARLIGNLRTQFGDASVAGWEDFSRRQQAISLALDAKTKAELEIKRQSNQLGWAQLGESRRQHDMTYFRPQVVNTPDGGVYVIRPNELLGPPGAGPASPGAPRATAPPAPTTPTYADASPVIGSSDPLQMYGRYDSAPQPAPSALSQPRPAPPAQPGFSVLVPPTANREYQRALDSSVGAGEGKMLAEDYTKTVEAANNATRQLAELGALEEANKRARTGALAETRLSLGRFARLLNIDPSVFTGDQQAAELMKSLGVVQSLNISQMTKGAISDWEGRQFLTAVPSLLNTREGNQAIIDFMRTGAVRAQYVQAAIDKLGGARVPMPVRQQIIAEAQQAIRMPERARALLDRASPSGGNGPLGSINNPIVLDPPPQAPASQGWRPADPRPDWLKRWGG